MRKRGGTGNCNELAREIYWIDDDSGESDVDTYIFV